MEIRQQTPTKSDWPSPARHLLTPMSDSHRLHPGMMTVSCLVPARGGSKGIPRKNIVTLGEYPLIAYTIAAARLSRYISDVVVTTDSAEIAATARTYGASVPFLRPPEISQDNSLDIEFFRHYTQFLRDRSAPIPDLIVHLRPTTPLRQPSVIDDAIQFIADHPEATSLRSMHETALTPYKIFRLDNGYAAPFMSLDGAVEFYNWPRQAFEQAYLPNGYVDVVRPTVLLESGLLHGDRIKLWKTERVPDIDVTADLSFARDELQRPAYSPLLQFLRGLDNA